MRLLIVGETVGRGLFQEESAYRGTYRDRPYYCETLADDHEVNQAFFWFIRHNDGAAEPEVVRDLKKALHLVNVYKEHAGQEFEIIELVTGIEQPQAGKQFLGYDLSRESFNSLLWYGLEVCYRSTGGWDSEREDILKLLQPLVCLIEHHFKPKLNANGLFNDYATAKACLDCMSAIQTICPDWFESGENTFEVVGLYRVDTEDAGSYELRKSA